MIGRRIESVRGLPIVGPVLLLVAAGLAGVGLAMGQRELPVVAILPAALGIALVLAREHAFAAIFQETELEIEHPAQNIPYSSLRTVCAPGRPRDARKAARRAFAIDVLHPEGQIRIPRRLDASSEEVYQFLVSQLGGSGSREVHPALDEHLAASLKRFGPEQVLTYRAIEKRRRPSRRLLRSVCLALIATGACWIALDPSRGQPNSPWTPLGLVVIIFGVIFLLLTFADSDLNVRAIKNWRKSSLVVTPDGLAMVQGEVQGTVTWRELRNVRFKSSAGSFHLTYADAQPGILLDVEGARILIPDIYDRPLHSIYESIVTYWRPGTQPANVEEAEPL